MACRSERLRVETWSNGWRSHQAASHTFLVAPTRETTRIGVAGVSSPSTWAQPGSRWVTTSRSKQTLVPRLELLRCGGVETVSRAARGEPTKGVAPDNNDGDSALTLPEFVEGLVGRARADGASEHLRRISWNSLQDHDLRDSRTNFRERAPVHPDLGSLPQHHLTPPPRRSMSFVAWLDHSTEDERRVREMIRLFDQPETQDALGFGQVRDAYGDLLFPGTSTLHTRAKYLLFIPWCSIAASKRGYTGERLERVSRDNERRLIQTLSSMPDVRGLIGGRRGWTVRNLPSGTYGTALRRWHIRGDDDQAVPSPDDDGELVAATHGWHRRLPAPPVDFPEQAPGAFTLTYGEAEYLQGRLLSIDGPQYSSATSPTTAVPR